ncbi:hypothetical protein AYI69_g5785 [Smittium culicis]|uniref:Ferric reductase NAD binding domain-containing protein n=1 Tax=Smittium culicis TaxID=133412 RepID=A0A1R1Y3E0_9FUNG|nr:hypothetical protein AYI69_g5785 [Smittium culicis]
MKNIYLSWSSHELDSFLILEELLDEIVETGAHGIIKIFLHTTGDYRISKLKVENIYPNLIKHSPQFVKIIPDRHNVYSLIEAVVKENPGNTYGIAAIGSKSLTRQARRTTNYWNKNSPFEKRINYYEGQLFNLQL